MGLKARSSKLEQTASAIEAASQARLETAADAEAAVELLEAYAADRVALEELGDRFQPLFHDVVALFQSVESREAAAVMRDRGLPILRSLYDERLAAVEPPTSGFDTAANALVFCLKIFAMYGEAADLDRIAAAARRPLDPEGFLWSVVFNVLAGADELGAVGQLKPDELTGFTRIALLDMANRRRYQDGSSEPHPFDDDRGRELLRGWLTNDNPDEASYAHSATAALPFISQGREPLLELADVHPSADVRVEAAYVRGRLGDPRGIETLSKLAADSRTGSLASTYLEELGRTDALPPLEPAQRAEAEMSQWLAHPNEFGAPPDALELVDSRRMFWPPTEDERDLYLFRYRYDRDGTEGVGMVGSITFALFGEATADISAEDIYALHCCWELQVRQDPRAPSERTVAEGRRLLGLTT